MISDREMARLAKEVYYVKETEVEIDGWKVESILENKDNGFKAAVFTRPNGVGGTDKVISYAGSDDGHDYLEADVDIVMGKVSHQWKEAKGFYESNVEGLTGITGHSLGGGLAQMTGSLADESVRIVTFNAPGVDGHTTEILERKYYRSDYYGYVARDIPVEYGKQGPNRNIMNYSDYDDATGNSGTHIGEFKRVNLNGTDLLFTYHSSDWWQDESLYDENGQIIPQARHTRSYTERWIKTQFGQNDNRSEYAIFNMVNQFDILTEKFVKYIGHLFTEYADLMQELEEIELDIGTIVGCVLGGIAAVGAVASVAAAGIGLGIGLIVGMIAAIPVAAVVAGAVLAASAWKEHVLTGASK